MENRAKKSAETMAATTRINRIMRKKTVFCMDAFAPLADELSG